MNDSVAAKYDPRQFKGTRYHTVIDRFKAGDDSPRDYLERCLNVIDSLEPSVKAFAALNRDTARAAADASDKRWRSGQPLSPIDGMPVGIKDLLETVDMPTQMGCAAYKGNFPRRDNAAVWALRQAGAIPLGKTVTAELGGSHPGPTRNPFDLKRTPGGSSSGSAAAVGSGMLPAAIGTQVGGSIIRPASYCGNIALKPSQGAINRGERQATSMSTHGVHATCFEDMWRVAIEISKRAGGDRGCARLHGPDNAPSALQPARLMLLETAGWEVLDAPSRAAFEQLVERLKAQNIAVIKRRDNLLVELLEESIAEASTICNKITSWENRWAQRNLVNEFPQGVSERAQRGLEAAERMAPDDYRAMLIKRDAAQRCHQQVAPLADAIITLASPGPAPAYVEDIRGEALPAYPTGNSVFNTPSSMLFAPVVTVPMFSVSGMPVGLQVMGQPHEDARITGIARWIHENIAPAYG